MNSHKKYGVHRYANRHKISWPRAAPIILACLIAWGYAISALPAFAAEEAQNPFTKALTDGRAYVDLRYRFEHVDQDGLGNAAKASTLRARFGYVSGTAYNFSARAEFEVIEPIGNDSFNSTTNGKSTYPTVADPEQAEINQLYLRYSGMPKSSLTIGRQRLILDNARFIGNVGFRQNEQTFDSAVLSNTSIPDTALTYAYLWNVNRIFGDSSTSGDFRTNAHLLNAHYAGFKFVKPTAYTYLIDFTDTDKENNSTATFGLRLTGAKEIATNWKALYTGEYAHQTDYGGSNVDQNHTYYTVEAGLSRAKFFSDIGVTVKVGYEVLEGDGTRAFQTPLATLHAFNGWTDKFLSTPANGIEDRYASMGTQIASVKILGVYHDFNAERGGLDHGSEWGISLSRTFFGMLDLGIKYANYNADNTSTDTSKLWLTAGVKF